MNRAPLGRDFGELYTLFDKMKAHWTIRYRLHPQTQAKARKLAGLAGACRFVWNHFVGKLRDEYLAYGRCKPWYYTLGKQFTLLRRYYEPWLQEYSMPIVRGVLQPLETTYKKFYKKEGGLPRFHAKYARPDSFPLCTGAFRMRGRYLHIARIGEVLLLGHNPYADGVPKSGTVKRECGKWYAYITYEVEQTEALRPVREVGIDRNVGQVTLSDGTMYRMPDTARHERRVRRYQRMMARRQGPNRKKRIKASNRWKRAQLLHQRAQAKLRHVRQNWCHGTSRQVADKYSLVHLEKLNNRGMTRSAKGTKDNPGTKVRAKAGLNRVILASCWGKFHQCLDYKTNTNYVDPAYTSQACNKCGNVDKNNRKTQSVFICTACGHRDNADVNAALNILASGNGAAGRGGGEVTRPVKRQVDTRFGFVKHCI